MTQYGVWVTNKPVPFQRHRLAQQADMQEGVVNAGDYKVTAHAAALSVDIAIGQAMIQIDTGTRNGLAFAFSDAVDTVVHAASDATNPRIDQIVLQYNDTTIPAGVGGDVPTTRVITGVATAGATLDNRNGAAALPADCVRLADVLIPAGSTTTSAANIRDRRPWARGFYWATQITAPTGNYTTASTVMADIDSVNLKPRAECAGVPLRFGLSGWSRQGTAGQSIYFSTAVDGVITPALHQLAMTVDATNGNAFVGFDIPLLGVAAGSHLLSWQWAISGGTGSLFRDNVVTMHVIEDVRQNANNT